MVTTRTRTYVAPIKPKKFPFLRLPLELRDRIYYYAIHQHYDTSANLLVLEGCDPIVLDQAEKPLSALAMVNRQLRLESRNAMHHHMTLCVVFARFVNSTPPKSASTKDNISKSFEELQKWRHIVLSPSDPDVNGCLSLAWPGRGLFLKILKGFFKFIVDNQHVLTSTSISMDLEGLHTLGAPNHTIQDTRMEIHEELDKFIQTLSAQFLKRVQLHIDPHTIGSMAYYIQKPENLAGLGYERVYIRVRDWCLQHRTIIKAMPQWIQWWDDNDGKYEWLDYDLVRNKVTGKSCYTFEL